MKFYCDRCGEVISGEPLKMVPSSCDKLTSMYIRKNLAVLMNQLADMDFCEECLTEIVDFALNKNTCDECVQQMMEENAMLREADSDSCDRDISKYRKAIEKYGVPKQCINIPVSSSGDGSEDI